jgi:hypothetical protein
MKINKLISSIVLLSFLAPQVVLAQSVPSPDPDPKAINIPPPALIPGEKDPGLALSPMKKRQRAPFTGVLLSPSAVANIIVEYEMFEERIHIEVMNAIAQSKADCDKQLSDKATEYTADKKIMEANIKSKDAMIKSFDIEVKRLNDEKNSRWHPGAWVGLGAASGIALTILTAFAISKASQ